jgi:hypothetical protein
MRAMNEPKRSAEELVMKLCIELGRVSRIIQEGPDPDILERIRLKEQLLKELMEFSRSIPHDVGGNT